MIKIKRVYDPAEPGDGKRILIDRLWPRGFKKEDLNYNFPSPLMGEGAGGGEHLTSPSPPPSPDGREGVIRLFSERIADSQARGVPVPFKSTTFTKPGGI